MRFWYKHIKRNSRNGFTLIETIVALAIIAIILVVALTGFNVLSRVDIQAQEWNAADESLEAAIAAGINYESYTTTSLTFSFVNPSASGETITISIPGKVLKYEHNGKTIQVFQAD